MTLGKVFEAVGAALRVHNEQVIRLNDDMRAHLERVGPVERFLAKTLHPVYTKSNRSVVWHWLGRFPMRWDFDGWTGYAMSKPWRIERVS